MLMALDRISLQPDHDPYAQRKNFGFSIKYFAHTLAVGVSPVVITMDP